MGETTGISWTDHTHNMWWGCVKVSEACRSCYALAWDKRTGGDHWGTTARRRFFGERHHAEPLKWNRAAEKAGKRERVFCSSMSDVFEQLPAGHPDAEAMDSARAQLWKLIYTTPMLDWQLLTKRPENIARMWPYAWRQSDRPPRNVWLGTTVEDQQRADERVRQLVAVPARVHFLSVEPQLEAIDFPRVEGIDHVEWIVVGGESGSKARPFEVEWARAAVRFCDDYGIAPFVKQMGDNPVPPMRAGHHGATMSMFPPDLQRQEFPREALQ